MMGHRLPCLKSVTCIGTTAGAGHFLHINHTPFMHKRKAGNDRRFGMSAQIESIVSIMLGKSHQQPNDFAKWTANKHPANASLQAHLSHPTPPCQAVAAAF